MWYRNKAIVLSDKMIAQIRVALTDMMGWFEEDLKAAWKHLFPVTSSSIKMGNLSLDHPAWGLTSDPR